MNIDKALIAGMRRDSDSDTPVEIATEESAALLRPSAPRALPSIVSYVHSDREQHMLTHFFRVSIGVRNCATFGMETCSGATCAAMMTRKGP